MRTALLLLLLAARDCPALRRQPDCVEVGGRPGRHALLRSARCRVRPRSSERRQSLAERRRSAPPASSSAPASPSRLRNAARRIATSRSGSRERTKSSSTRAAQVTVEHPRRAGAAGGAHAESLSGRQAGRWLPAQHDQLRADRRAARHARRDRRRSPISAASACRKRRP